MIKKSGFRFLVIGLLIMPSLAIYATNWEGIGSKIERVWKKETSKARQQVDLEDKEQGFSSKEDGRDEAARGAFTNSSCSQPLALALSELSSTTAVITWEASAEEQQGEVAIQPLGEGIPTQGERVSALTFTAEGLLPNTTYEVYVRTVCTSAGELTYSNWADPLILRTALVPVALPYNENFETNPTWGISNDATNQWHIGTAVNHGGSHALYISNDQGISNAYTDNSVQVSHAYQDLIIPETAVDLSVTFDWRNVGERGSDDFRVWLVPIQFVPQPGTRISTGDSRGIQLDYNQFYGQENFTPLTIERDIVRYAGQTMRLVFEWKNSEEEGNQPPAALDNLEVFVAHCVKPTRLEVSDITQNTAEIAWRNTEDTTRYDIFLSTTPTEPNATTTPTYSGVTNPHSLINLVPNTRYYVWIRSACSATSTSLWLGGLNFLTLQLPATLPFYDDFEETLTWSTTASTNQWTKGRAFNQGGTQAIYISDDQGDTYHCDTSVPSVSHIYRDIAIPQGVEELTLKFDWHIEGATIQHYPIEFFRFIKTSLDYTPESEYIIDTNFDGQLLGRPYYIQSEGWKTEVLILDVTENQGEVIRLVFEWINDITDGGHLPAAIDNFSVEVSSCQSPTNLKAEIIKYTNNFRFSWVPQGNETKWEVYNVYQGTVPPDFDTVGIIVEGEPQLTIENVEESQYFVYYVRAICQGENGENKTAWVGPISYSYFIPPVCAELEGGVEGMPNNEADTYIICEDGAVAKTLSAHYFNSKKTNDYQVEAIDYNPPFPFFGGDMVTLTEDDEWSDRIDLGFDFCFYENTYNQILISTNGTITFSIEGDVADGRYEPLGWSEWLFDQPIPFPSRGEDAPFLNAVFGVMQDLDPRYSPADHSVNYQILGAFPCRALVFNIYHLGLYDMDYDPEDIEGTTQTSQIVLYEATNIIEVYVKNRPVVPEENYRHNQGNGVIGIHNADGTIAHYPGMYPGDTVNRNTGDWTASEEAWRFTPAGESAVDFKWLKEGEYFSSEEVIDVEITKSVTYTARATYEACEGNELVIERVFHFLKDDFDMRTLPNYEVCGNVNDVGNKVDVDISATTALILAALGEENSDNYTIEYFKDEALTLPLTEVVSVQNTQTVYGRLSNLTTQCVKIGSFNVVRIQPLVVSKHTKVEACARYVLPELAEGERYFSSSLGQGIEYLAGEVYELTGESTLYIYKENDKGCYGESNFQLVLYEAIAADIVEDQVMQCENFILPKLAPQNTYYTESNKGGIALAEGMEVLLPMTLYIYAENGSQAVSCWDESSFTFAYEDCPIPKGFSPNGDGINDSFDLSEHGISKIQIFNRHGLEVYSHDEGYTNQFVGKDKARNQLPSGTYYYVVVARGKLKTGWVQLNE